MFELHVKLNGCEVDTASLTGFMAVSSETPNDYRGAEVSTEVLPGFAVLVMRFDAEPTPGQLTEVLRVLGGAAKGDNPMEVIAPGALAGRTAVPHESRGARRWACPRCGVSVMQGHNDTRGALFGMCARCSAVDQGRSPDGPPPPQTMADRPRTGPPTPAARERVSPAFAVVPIVHQFAALPHPPPAPGLLAVLESGELVWSTAAGWRLLEGRIPPLG